MYLLNQRNLTVFSRTQLSDLFEITYGESSFLCQSFLIPYFTLCTARFSFYWFLIKLLFLRCLQVYLSIPKKRILRFSLFFKLFLKNRTVIDPLGLKLKRFAGDVWTELMRFTHSWSSSIGCTSNLIKGRFLKWLRGVAKLCLVLNEIIFTSIFDFFWSIFLCKISWKSIIVHIGIDVSGWCGIPSDELMMLRCSLIDILHVDRCIIAWFAAFHDARAHDIALWRSRRHEGDAYRWRAVVESGVVRIWKVLLGIVEWLWLMRRTIWRELRVHKNIIFLSIEEI